MAGTKVKHRSVEERAAKGKQCREKTPVSSHTDWVPAPDRPDPVALLEEQNLTREQDLVPVRHGRMLVSPFTFYRGAAKIMAADLKDTPRAGLTRPAVRGRPPVQLRRLRLAGAELLFDLNDFDETLPGPFEYDVKRMSASFTIAARNNAFTKDEAHDATLTAVRAYREAMAQFAQMRTLDIWYTHLSEEQLMEAIDLAVASRRERPQEGCPRYGKVGATERRKGPYPGQPAGTVQARRARRREVPDRQPATDRHPRSGAGRIVRHVC